MASTRPAKCRTNAAASSGVPGLEEGRAPGTRASIPGPFAMKLVVATMRGPTRRPATASALHRRLSSGQAMKGSPGRGQPCMSRTFVTPYRM
jgi:hypothetical protein